VRRCAKCATVMRALPPLYRTIVVLLVASLNLCACSSEVQCKSEVTDGSASFTGYATGKAETDALRKGSLRDACLQRCAAAKAPLLDSCATACIVDVDAKKIGGRTTCGKK
jgi:hypothetical protein